MTSPPPHKPLALASRWHSGGGKGCSGVSEPTKPEGVIGIKGELLVLEVLIKNQDTEKHHWRIGVGSRRGKGDSMTHGKSSNKSTDKIYIIYIYV